MSLADDIAKHYQSKIGKLYVASEQEILQKEQAEAMKRIGAQSLRGLKSHCPRLYECTLDNYEVHADYQKKVLQSLKRIRDEFPRFMKEKRSLFFFGSVGTGKDHLGMAMLKIAAWHGYSVRWAQGLDFYEAMVNAHRNSTTTEDVLYRYVKPDILLLSDPIFPSNWSTAKQEALRKLVRRRWDKGRPTWVTVNVEDLKSSREAFGEDTLDRLRHGASMFQMVGKSYRGNTDGF